VQVWKVADNLHGARHRNVHGEERLVIACCFGHSSILHRTADVEG
jgi:hypothetical protein